MSKHKHALRVALVWKGSVFRERTFSQTSEQTITIGESQGATFRTPADPLDANLEMFERTDRGYTVRFTDQLDGSITLNGEEWSLASLIDKGRAEEVGRMATEAGGTTIYEFEIVRGDWGLIELGSGEVFFQVLRQPSRVAGRGVESLDVPVMGMALLAAIAHLLILLIASLSYNVEPELQQVNPPDQWATLMEPVDQSEQTMAEPEESTEPERAEQAAPAAEDPAGRLGNEESDEKTEGSADKTDVASGETLDATKVGVLEALSGASESGAIGDVFDRESHEGRFTKLEGDASGPRPGRGTGGVNIRGLGDGGGGVGNVGTIGGVPGGKGGAQTGAKLPDNESGRREPPSVTRDPVTSGDQFCDKQNIQQVVSSQKLAIRHCYNKQLQTNPDLSGKVVVQWKIGLDGAVKSASVANSTMGDKEVGRCLARVVRSRMTFDEPEGGICVVKYPFVFSGGQ